MRYAFGTWVLAAQTASPIQPVSVIELEGPNFSDDGFIDVGFYVP